jgi:hypothetical protein
MDLKEHASAETLIDSSGKKDGSPETKDWKTLKD